MKIVDVKNINYSYDGINKVLDNVNFYIEKAKIMTIVGPNGAGKSTLLKLLIGELSIQNGKINYFDEKGDIKPDKNIKIGYVPQNSSSYGGFPIKAREVVEMGVYKEAGLARRINRELKQKVKDIMEELEISNIAEKNMSELSGGQRQKIFVARAVVNSPEILFLDEPFSGIDTSSQKMFYEFIKKLRDKKEIAIIMVTHDLVVVPQISDTTLCVNIKATFHKEPNEFIESAVFKDEFSNGLEIYLHDKNIPHRTVKRKEGD